MFNQAFHEFNVLGIEISLYYKARQVLLQSASIFITKCVRYYKVRQNVLQSAVGISKCGIITKWVVTEGHSLGPVTTISGVEFFSSFEKRMNL